MRTGFLGRAVVGWMLVTLGMLQLAVAQTREPTVDERFRDATSNAADEAVPHLNAPQTQSKLAPPKAAAGKGKAVAYLGVTFAAKEQRAIVSKVAPGSPAEQAGLQPNDLIETLQGRQVKTNQDVLDIVAMLKPGDVLDIGFSRRMNIRTQAPLASMPTGTPHSVGYPPNQQAGPMPAPEDPVKRPAPTISPQPKNNAQATPRPNPSSAQQSTNNSSQQRNSSQNNNRSEENRRGFGRGLRLR